MAQSLIKLHPLGVLGHDSKMFGCTIGGKQFKVVPQHLYHKQNEPGIPVRCGNIRYTLWSVYSTFMREYELFMYAAGGPYKGFKGPKISNQTLNVTHKDFGNFFSYCLWKRMGDSVMAVRVDANDPEALQQHLDRGYELDAPAEVKS